MVLSWWQTLFHAEILPLIVYVIPGSRRVRQVLVIYHRHYNLDK